MSAIIKLTGQTFGRLTVTQMTNKRRGKSVVWRCVCQCGNFKDVASIDLRSDQVQSCGCLRRELSSSRNTTHGHTRNGKCSKEFIAWSNMIRRCYNPNEPAFKNYGGRGIVVCPQWLNSFPTFLVDMGTCPPGLTLERKDINGDYEPKNCKWATVKEQNRNTRRTRLLEGNGRVQCLEAWAEEIGIAQSTLWMNLTRRTLQEELNRRQIRT